MQITFEGIRGSSFTGDIAIDDVSLMDGMCTGKNQFFFIVIDTRYCFGFERIQFSFTLAALSVSFWLFTDNCPIRSVTEKTETNGENSLGKNKLNLLIILISF